MTGEPRRDLLIKIKRAKMAGYRPKKVEESVCHDLHKLGFIGKERVLASGRSDDHQDNIFYRFYIKPKGHRYLGCYGAAVSDVLYRGGSTPLGMDRHGRACNHSDGVFLSKDRNIAEYYANRFDRSSPFIEECTVSIHSLMEMEGKGMTSPELRLNQARARWINNYDSIRVHGMHMGHLDDAGQRIMTDLHKEFEVPLLSDIFIVFNAWDVLPLNERSVDSTKQLDHEQTIDNEGVLELTKPGFLK